RFGGFGWQAPTDPLGLSGFASRFHGVAPWLNVRKSAIHADELDHAKKEVRYSTGFRPSLAQQPYHQGGCHHDQEPGCRTALYNASGGSVSASRGRIGMIVPDLPVYAAGWLPIEAWKLPGTLAGWCAISYFSCQPF